MSIKIYSTDDIVFASYGILDRYKDVSNILKSILNNNMNSPVLITSNLFKYDPYFGKTKELNIKLKSNKILKIKDNSYIEYIEIYGSNEPVHDTSNLLHNRITTILEKTNILQYNYIVSTNARDESNILEWIVYHLLIGFDHVVIVDHRSIKPIKDIIRPYYWRHRVEVIRNETDGPVKMDFLNKIIIPYMTKYCKKYFIHLDADEYIYIKNNLSIEKLLSNYNNCNILALNWLIYGSNNLDKNESLYKCLIPAFTSSDNMINSHFKCLIRVDKNIKFSFINPHQVILRNIPSTYTNVLNKNVEYKDSCYEHMNLVYPEASLDSLPCYINHYMVQSKEDYNNRKILRNRDDIPATRNIDEDIFNRHNTIKNNNLEYYVDTIYYMLKTCCFQFGFIMIRCVNSIETDESWKTCYNSIRQFYNNMIVIVDDNSSVDFVTDHHMINCTIIKSEYPKRGEFLPYYYYIKNRYFDRAIVIHDSMKFNSYYDFNNITNYKNFTRLFSFGNPSYRQDIEYFKEFTNCIYNGSLLNSYHLKNIDRLIGCFGTCYIVDHDYIMEIEKKYNISNLVKCIDSRPKRKTLERFISCLFEMDKSTSRFNTRDDILGSIFNNDNSIVEKHFFGR